MRMLNQFSRTQLLFGPEAMERLARSRVAVFGIGGVGGYAVEALARSGIGALDLIDDDKVCLTNLNRQLHATRKTVGKYKVDVAEERILEINPDCRVRTYKTFYLPETQDQFDFSQYDYLIDCVDDVNAKMAIIKKGFALNIKTLSSMGTGNKLDPSKLKIVDIEKTTLCPLARVMRRKCREAGIKHLKVVYSEEEPKKCGEVVSSMVFVPASAGLLLASYVVRTLISEDNNEEIR